MARVKIKWRAMDTDNRGIEWTGWTDAEISDEGDEMDCDARAAHAAKQVNQVSFEQTMGPITADTPDDEKIAPGVLTAARGDSHHGIAWFEDRGHQGATSLVLEWHPAD